MITDVGEYIVGAYLRLVLNCDFIEYNVRPPGGGLEGLGELDVLGLDFKNNKAYLCEVTTHISGLQIGKNYESTVIKIAQKHQRQIKYAEENLKQFEKIHYMYWSPVVSKGGLLKGLENIEGFELYINGKYKKCIEELRQLAAKKTHDAKNPFFRMLQIMEHLRD